MMTKKNTAIAALLGAVLALSACSTNQVVDTTVDASGFVVKTAAKGAVGAGKLAFKGAKKVAGAGQ